MIVLGWDVGGVNIKVARVEDGRLRVVRGRPFELRHSPQALAPLLRELADECGAGPNVLTHALTMTAELSQLFRTKREGVAFVLDAVTAAFPSSPIRVFAVDGRFVDSDEARANPLAVAAANWAATATFVARHHPDALLIDTGTTTTDIIPIVRGAAVAEGRTDPDRLASGELVYTGALRTPVEAIASHVMVGGRRVGVAAEGFAIAGDVHVWRGDLAAADYTVPAPDGRPSTREFAGERLARAICADREMLDEAGVSEIADAFAAAQVDRIAEGISRAAARHPSVHTAIVTGLGAFLGTAAACRAGLQVSRLSDDLGEDAARFAPAAAVALLLDNGSHQSSVASHQSVVSRARDVEVVVKVGGGLLKHPDDLDRALTALSDVARYRRLLIVPGGGPFADGVRAIDKQLHLSDDAAHWMAIRAMDQYAHVIVDRMSGCSLVAAAHEIEAAYAAGRIPVLTPYQWLRVADPLPHSWEVTSDSIAAWVSGVVGARKLVLIKPSGASGADLVDAHLSRALPAHVSLEILTADHVDALASTLGGG